MIELSGDYSMNKVEKLKNAIYEEINIRNIQIINQKEIMHPLLKELMTFNVIFSSIDMPRVYNITGFENEEKACCFILEITGEMEFYEDLYKDILIGYTVEFKDTKGNEKIVKISRWFDDKDNISVNDLFNCIV